MLEQFSQTIDRIYSAAADAERWTDALRAIEDFTGSTGAVLNMVPKLESAAPVAMAGSFSESDCADYAVNHMWRCPRIAFAAANPHIPIAYDRMIMTEAQMDRDATYEWYGKHGLRYYVAGWIGESRSHRAYMSLQRSRRQGHVEPDQIAQFALIRVHMTNALALATKLGTLEARCRVTAHALDANRNAIFFLNSEGGLDYWNAAADELLCRDDLLTVHGGRLQCKVESEQATLDRLLSSAWGLQDRSPRGGWTRIRRTTGRMPCVCLVSPMPQPTGEFASGATAMLIICDPENTAGPDEGALQDMFGFTSAEAHIARALAGGHSVESAAAVLAIKPATIRCHLKSVFRKLGVNRQQDLVRLMSSLAPV